MVDLQVAAEVVRMCSEPALTHVPDCIQGSICETYFDSGSAAQGP